MISDPVKATKTLSPSADVLFQALKGESVLLNLSAEHYYSLDEVGTRVWQLLAEHGDPEQVVAQLLAEYDVEEETLRGDLDRLFNELAEAGLISKE